MSAAFGREGFTLLELLLALTLVALIAVLAYGSLRIGIRAWEKGEQGTGQKERVVMQLMRRQIASILVPSPFTGEDAPPVLFGSSDSLILSSYVGLMPENNQGPVFVRYSIRQQGDFYDLLFWEKPIALIKNDELSNSNLDDMQILLEDMHTISFLYMQKNDEEGETDWHRNWPPEEGISGLPQGVKISLQKNEDNPANSILIPIRPTLEEEKK